MISFYPGPSRVHDEIPKWTAAAAKQGILSMNHRSTEFMDLSRETVKLLKTKLNIPNDYTIYFTSSATECWEIIAQSLIERKSIHIHNGAFGEKWFDYTRRLRPYAVSEPFEINVKLNPIDLIFRDGEVICITQNETSNGTQVENKIIRAVQNKNPNHLIAVDATSSMAGVDLEFVNADVWFASVQKCFGLPAGLAILVCSPKAIRKMHVLNELNHYNSLSFMHTMMEKWQTSCTPNVLGIYFLNCAMKKASPISAVDKRLTRQQKAWNVFFKKSKTLSVVSSNPAIQSKTVIAVKGDPTLIERVKGEAKKKGLLLGEGYGKMKSETFRIANFPALKEGEIKKLMGFLRAYL